MEKAMPSRDRGRLRAPDLTPLLIAVSVLSLGAGVGQAAAAPAKSSPPATTPQADEQSQYFQCMEQRIRVLEEQLKSRSAAPAATTGEPPDVAPSPAATAPKSARSEQAVKAAQSKADAAIVPPGKPKPAADPCSPAPKAPSPPAARETAALLPPLPSVTGSEKPILGVAESPVAGLSIGAYGEVFFGAMQNPAAGGQWQNGADGARRLVLLPTYQITDNIIFNAEIEFEHAGPGFDNDDKLHGTAEIEQLWIDFKIVDQLNWRAPGIDLVPIGYINQHHEPTQFYSVNRPELYNGLIPSTWKVPATSIYGTIADGVKYQIMLSTSNEDFGDSFANRTAANTVPPFPTPYFPGIDGVTALA